MKRKTKLLLTIIFLIFFLFLAAIFVNPIIIFLAKKQLSSVFKESEVSIESCHLNLSKQLSFFDIRIKNKNVYNLLVKEAKAEYSIFSIFKGKILKFSLKDMNIYANLSQKKITTFSQYLNLNPKGAFLIGSLELSNFNFDLTAKDFNIKGALSSRVNPTKKLIGYLDIKIDSLGVLGLNLSNISLKAEQGSSLGYFRISQIKYNKLTISKIKSQTLLLGKELFLKNIYARAFEGDISGNLKFKIDRDFSYDGLLKIINLDIAKFINDFDLREKFEMTGKLSGNSSFKGRGSEIEILNGEFSSLESGGVFIIKDRKLLENMARSTNQPLNLLVENLENYIYDIGRIKLFLNNSDLTLDVALDGETGKRELKIVLHNFILKKEER